MEWHASKYTSAVQIGIDELICLTKTEYLPKPSQGQQRLSSGFCNLFHAAVNQHLQTCDNHPSKHSTSSSRSDPVYCLTANTESPQDETQTSPIKRLEVASKEGQTRHSRIPRNTFHQRRRWLHPMASTKRPDRECKENHSRMVSSSQSSQHLNSRISHTPQQRKSKQKNPHSPRQRRRRPILRCHPPPNPHPPRPRRVPHNHPPPSQKQHSPQPHRKRTHGRPQPSLHLRPRPRQPPKPAPDPRPNNHLPRNRSPLRCQHLRLPSSILPRNSLRLSPRRHSIPPNLHHLHSLAPLSPLPHILARRSRNPRRPRHEPEMAAPLPRHDRNVQNPQKRNAKRHRIPPQCPPPHASLRRPLRLDSPRLPHGPNQHLDKSPLARSETRSRSRSEPVHAHGAAILGGRQGCCFQDPQWRAGASVDCDAVGGDAEE